MLYQHCPRVRGVLLSCWRELEERARSLLNFYSMKNMLFKNSQLIKIFGVIIFIGFKQ